MASAWGLSWGEAWNGAWGSIDGDTPAPPAATPPAPRGQLPWLVPPSDSGPTNEQRRRSRILHGIESDVVHEVAARQAEHLDLDELQRKEELLGELKLARIEARAEHFAELARIRESLIDAEIARRIQAIMAADDDAAALLMILGAACE